MATSSGHLGTHRESALEVYLLGVVDFDSATALQQRLVYDAGCRDDTQGTLILCEHPPIVTIGREGSRSDVLATPHELRSRQLDIRWLNRGGGTIVHGNGQLAVYPILPLGRMKIGLADYRRRLEETVIDVCAELKVPATRREDDPGVWCRCGQFAHFGASVKSWTSYHGLAINVSPSMDLMRLARPPAESRITSLSAQRLRPTSMHTVREAFVRRFVERFDYQRFHIYTGHPLLTRTRKRVYVPA